MPEQAGRDKHPVEASASCAGTERVADSLRGKRDNQERPMDWDEVRAKPKPGAAIGENLETLSVAELEARIAELEREIARVKRNSRPGGGTRMRRARCSSVNCTRDS